MNEEEKRIVSMIEMQMLETRQALVHAETKLVDLKSLKGQWTLALASVDQQIAIYEKFVEELERALP